MRSQEEIVAYIEKAKSGAPHQIFYVFTVEALLGFLEFKHAEKAGLLKEGVGPEEWEEVRTPLTKVTVLTEMEKYMKFAIGKAENHRGISANRSIEKMESWIWLLGDDDFLDVLKGTGYAQYGVPQLLAICEEYDFPYPIEQTWFQNMSVGQPCHFHCDEGCGK